MAGIEGMKDGSQPERDRPVISQSAALTLMSVSLSECRGAEKNNTITVICCSYFNHKVMNCTSTDESTKLCDNGREYKQHGVTRIPPEKVLVTQGHCDFPCKSCSHSHCVCCTRCLGSCAML